MPADADAEAAVSLAELQYRAASARCLPAARRTLLAAIKASLLAMNVFDGIENVPMQSWTDTELDNANQVLCAKGFAAITKDDTVVWDMTGASGTRAMIFYATPACHWIPATVKAASTRILAVEERLGRAGAREIFKPPFVVVIIGYSDITLMMVPEIVLDLQSSANLLGPALAEARGLVPIRAPSTRSV